MIEAWRDIDRYLAARKIRIGPPTLAQTVGGKHAPTSAHYSGRARDYGKSNSDMVAILAALTPHATGTNHVLRELYGLNTFYKAGAQILPTKGLFSSHQNHVHVALRHGATLPVPDTQEALRGALMADSPDLPNIEGPLQLVVVADQAGMSTGYYIFSISTGELHSYGPGAKYYGRSEELTPD